MSLFNDSLKFTSSDTQICWYFFMKNVSSICTAKATHISSAKNIRILYIESAKTVNEMTINELVKQKTLWTTAPWNLAIRRCNEQNAIFQPCSYLFLFAITGVFLLCWWPFFTVNIMRAICLRYEVLNYPKCDIDVNVMGFFVWLGYINSFLNPVIYTIFNPEFRKAFKKILSECCKICDIC